VPHEDMLNRFEEVGAAVVRAGQRVRIPADLVARSIESAGKQFTLYGRDMKQTAASGRGTRNFNDIAGEAHWLDEIGAQCRFATMNDVVTAARFCDALPNINIAGAMADPHETTVDYRCVEVCAMLLRNTTMRGFKSKAKVPAHPYLSSMLRGDGGICDLRKVISAQRKGTVCPQQQSPQSLGHLRKCLPISPTAIESSERPIAVVGQRPSWKSPIAYDGQPPSPLPSEGGGVELPASGSGYGKRCKGK